METKYISYLRISTKHQETGLSIEAQRQAVSKFIKCDDCIIQEYYETESGTKNKRRELLKAIAHCKRIGATLVIAKMDRLSRDAHFTLTLMKENVKFLAADLPGANELTIKLIAVINEDEVKRIRTRIVDALAVKKQQLALINKKLGTPKNLTYEARMKGVMLRKQDAIENERMKDYSNLVKFHHGKGKSIREISRIFNSENKRTVRDKEFAPMQIKRLLDRQ